MRAVGASKNRRTVGRRRLWPARVQASPGRDGPRRQGPRSTRHGRLCDGGWAPLDAEHDCRGVRRA